MSGSGRRRHSKWDLKEDISPENLNENARSNKDRSSFDEHESRDHMSGTRDVQRAEGMKKESIVGLEGDGHYATRKSTGPDGGRQQSRTHSPRSRGRSFRSRSRSKSRSRSPVRNPRHQPGLNDQSGKSGHSAPLCRDFAAGRCRQGDRCHFVHHSSSGKHLDERIGSDRENMHRDDDALKSHSDIHSTRRRSTNICNDFLKGKCRRGASCKYSHHNPGSDESGKETADGSYQDGHNYRHNKHVYTETKSPDETRLKHHLNGIQEVLGDGKWGDKALPKAHGAIRNSSSNMDLCVSSDIPPVQGTYRLDESFSASPIISVNGVQQSQPTFFSHPMCEGMQMPCHQATIDTKQGDGKTQTAFPLHQTEREDMQKLHHQSVVDSTLDDGAYMANVEVSQDALGPATPSESGVLNGQLSQIPPHFSATLAHLFEKRDQLPQLYAASNSQRAVMDGGSDLANSLASVMPVSESASLLNQATDSRLSDPMWDSIETKMASTDSELQSSSIEQRSSVLGTLVTPASSAITASFVAGETTASDLLEVCFSGDDVLGHQSLDPNQRGPVNNENEGATGKGANEAQEQGSVEDMAVNDNVNDDKKAKDVKEMRPFKFALAEFVKELLKPTWKEGKMSKEVHKTIVKKVVDKVSDSIQEAHIPRTKEKIDQYLSFSKPKLSKLVQAYLERYKKP